MDARVDPSTIVRRFGGAAAAAAAAAGCVARSLVLHCPEPASNPALEARASTRSSAKAVSFPPKETEP